MEDIRSPFLPTEHEIAFSCAAPGGELRICTRKLDQAGVMALPGTEGVEKIFFSPDGQWIGYGARGKLKKVSVQGGAPFLLADASFDRGAAWGEDGFIVASLIERTGLLRIPEGGGTPKPLPRLQSGENTHRWPQVLPGARAVLFTANSQPGDYEDASVEVFSLQVLRLHALGLSQHQIARSWPVLRWVSNPLMNVAGTQCFGITNCRLRDQRMNTRRSVGSFPASIGGRWRR